ncbi:hypothetical protein NAS2_1169 [Conexivisphaera calida]|uniref:Glycosyl transferase family 28 C-terminal domain-containing protein n=1 Tax=Conexivisphaera calida TaxID=1874277 RepID=A0A4P2VNP1_9ARCH|nr:hypothetical protein NAS2_1169 [Conexivisphaera calida]
MGLGHVARDLHLRRMMDWADVEWLTSGNAIRFLEENGEAVHEASRRMGSLGDVIGGSLIRNCTVTLAPGPLMELYSAVKSNARIVDGSVDLESYDVVIADEFWELLLSERVPRRGAFITDFVDLSPKLWWAPVRPAIARLGDAIRARASERFDLRIHVGIWGDAAGFWHPGQLITDAAVAAPTRRGPVVVNTGGTPAGCAAARGISSDLSSRGIEHVVIGACGELTGNPGPLISRSSALVTLAGYSSLVEVAITKKPAVVLPVRRHFEHVENSRAFVGRNGYRVVQCSRGVEVTEELLEVLHEDPDPPPVIDATPEIVDALRGLL